ncbi:hypothetical protein [Enterococcus faecium]|nr:hypothetical protein [Enterococcus faecium]
MSVFSYWLNNRNKK